MDLLEIIEQEYLAQLLPAAEYVAMAAAIQPELRPDMALSDTQRHGCAWDLNKLSMHLTIRSILTTRVKGYPAPPLELIRKAGARTYAEMEKAIYKPGVIRMAGSYPLHRMVLLVKHASQMVGTPLDRFKWLDLSAGHGDRLVTSLLLDIDYDCIDPRAELLAIYERVRACLPVSTKKGQHVVGCSERPESYAGLSPGYDFVFACPPYFDKELYGTGESGSAPQSVRSFPCFEGWVAGFLLPSIRLGWERVRPGGCMMINIAHPALDPERIMRALDVVPAMMVVGGKMYAKLLSASPIYVWCKPV